MTYQSIILSSKPHNNLWTNTIVDIIVPNTTYKVDVPDSIMLVNISSHASKLISYRFLAPGMDDIPTQDTIPIHFPQFQPTSSQTQLDNNDQPLSPQLFNSNDHLPQETITLTDSSQSNSLRTELDSPQITISSDNTNSNEAQQGSTTDILDDKPYDNTIEKPYTPYPTITTEPQDQMFHIQRRNIFVKF